MLNVSMLYYLLVTRKKSAMDDTITTSETQRLTKVVLVIEDDPAIRDLLDIHLRKRGYVPMMYVGAEEALEDIFTLLRNVIVEVMIIDVMLPGMDGVSFIKELERRGRRNAPIMVISAHLSAERKAQEVHAEGYTRKPFHFEKLMDSCERLVAAYQAKQRLLRAL